MNRYLFEMMLRLINEQLDAQEGLLTEARRPLIKTPFGSQRDSRAFTVRADIDLKRQDIQAWTSGSVARQEAFETFINYLSASVGRVSASASAPRTNKNKEILPRGYETLPQWYPMGWTPSIVYQVGDAATNHNSNIPSDHYGSIIEIENMGPASLRNDIIDNLTGSNGVTYGGWTFQIDPQYGLRKYSLEPDKKIGGILSAYRGNQILTSSALLSQSSPSGPTAGDWMNYSNALRQYQSGNLGNIQRFQIHFKAGSKGTNTSELFEGNLIRELGPDPTWIDSLNGDQDWFNEDQAWQDIANNIVANITGSGLGKKELIGKTYYKPGNVSGSVTTIYNVYKARSASTTPKTDIASTEKGEKQLRISVKKKGGSLLSSEFAETQAIMAIALGFGENAEPDDQELTNLFNDVRTELEKKSPKGQKLTDINRGTSALNKINEYIINKSQEGINFKEKFLLEAITGNNRFKPKTSVAIANRLLFWDESGTGSYYNIEEWVNGNYNEVTFRARSQGKDRTVGLGIDPGKPTETPNEEINEFLSFDPEMQIDLERPAIPPTPVGPEYEFDLERPKTTTSQKSIDILDQQINELILTAIGYSLKEVDPGSNTVTIGDPDPQQQKKLETMVQKILEPFDKQPQKEPKIPDNVVALDPKIPDNVVALDPKDVKSTKDDKEIKIDVKDDEQEKQEQNNTEET